MPEIGSGFSRMQKILLGLSQKGQTSVVKAVCQEAVALSMACFREGRDPYGARWAALKHRNGKPLLDTGRGRASVTSSRTADGFRIGFAARYMGFHQDGVDKTYHRAASSRNQALGANGRFISRKAAGKKRQGTLYNATRFTRLNFKGGETHLVIPRRAFLPIPGRGLGLWQPALEHAARLAIARLAKG